MKIVFTVRIIFSGILISVLLCIELIFWIWYKLFEQLVKRPQIVTFGLNAKGASFIIQKAAQGACWLLFQLRKWLLIIPRYWLWNHFRLDLIQYYPSIYRKSQQIYGFLQQIRNFFTGP